jgi:hypothetical protein
MSATEPLYELVDVTGRGLALCATRYLDPGVLGLTILHDVPLITSPLRDSPEDRSGPCPPLLKRILPPQFWTDYWCFRQLPFQKQQTIKTLYYNQDDAKELQQVLEQLHSKTNSIPTFDLEEFSVVSMVFRLNAAKIDETGTYLFSPVLFHVTVFSVPRGKMADSLCHCYFFLFKIFSGRRGMFEWACRLNHSCLPNCVWYTSEGKRMVRLVQPVPQGEEFTIDYIESRTLPTPIRRKRLLQTKQFDCQCPRCQAPWDTTRPFPCVQCPDGIHFCPASGDWKDPLSDCTQCGATPSLSMPDASRQEESVQQDLDRLNRLLKADADEGYDLHMSSEDYHQIRSLRPPHKLHYLAGDSLFIVQANQLQKEGDPKGKIQKCRERLECYQAILGNDYPNVLTAVACQLLADALLEDHQLDAAEDMYQAAVRIFRITDGPDRPLSQNAVEKVLEVQSQSQTMVAKDDPSSSAARTTKDASLCALCGAPAGNKCSRCGHVGYCSREHQKAHWLPVHKGHCQKKELA